GLLGCLAAALGLLSSAIVLAEEKVEDPDEALLREAKVGADTESIVTYLRSKSESDEDLLNIDKVVEQLGSRTFRKREQAERKPLKLGLPGSTPKAQRAGGARFDQSPEKTATNSAERSSNDTWRNRGQATGSARQSSARTSGQSRTRQTGAGDLGE